MSYSSYLLGLNEHAKTSENNIFLFNEADFPSADKSGFNDEDIMGDLKINKPESEGLSAAIAAEDQFAVTSDGKDTDVEPSFHEAFPKDKSGFEKDAKLNESEGETEFVAPETIPSAPAEADQYSNPAAEDIACAASDASPEELATDDSADEINLGESVTGWDDLF